jgi:site-specific DNA-methyltransferase (cytosine-N4-specific)
VSTTTITTTVTLRADAINLPVRTGSVQCVVTSPPYLGQRVYGEDSREMGAEDTLADYISGLLLVAEEIRRILRPDGLLWLNLGDKANRSGGAGGDYGQGGDKSGRPKYGKFYDRLYAPGQFLDVPGKTLTALQLKGWRLRQYVIWNKDQESREDLKHVRRPRTSHEVILMLAPTKERSKAYPERLPETGSVWTFPTARSERKGHQAPFPDELARRCVLASTDPGDLVLDPFVGSGTTTRVAQSLRRRAIGVDLYTGRNS